MDVLLPACRTRQPMACSPFLSGTVKEVSGSQPQARQRSQVGPPAEACPTAGRGEPTLCGTSAVETLKTASHKAQRDQFTPGGERLGTKL